MLEQGYILLHRSLLHWEWYGDRNVRDLFVHLLLTVNYEPQRWRGMVIGRGQRAYSRATLAAESGLTEQQVRTALAKLLRTGEVTSEKSPQSTVLTVVNYDRYQQATSQSTGEQPEVNQAATRDQPAINRDGKKAKESKEEKEKAPLKGGQKERAPQGEFGNVYLSAEERAKLEQRFGNNETAQAVEELSAYCRSRGRSYRDYYATLVNWCKRNAEKGPPRPQPKSFAELAAEMEGME